MKKNILNPLISVVMSNYNCEKYISQAIESILNQTYVNFEFIIIDDCSIDNSLKIIQKYAKKDNRIKVYKNDKNLGRAKSYNLLLDKISDNSKYFLFVGSDDILLNTLIEIKVRYLEKNSQIFGLGNSINYVDENLRLIKTRVYPKKNTDIINSFLLFSPFCQGGMMLRSELKKEKFNERLNVCVDYELWTRLITKGYYFENLSDVLYLYRQFKNQAKQKNLKESIINTIKIKSEFLFRWKYFSIIAFLRLLFESFLLILPKKVVLWLFYRLK